MKKTPLFILILAFLVFSLAGIAYSWQGRMAGMGDPYGLIMDESDFLIHPAKIADGKGINFYGNYRFNYTDVMDWNYTLKRSNVATGAPFALEPFRSSGDEQEHNALVGVAFPLGPGRMGLFFQYTGRRGDFSGHENEMDSGSFYYHRFSLDSDLDAFVLRLLYGLSMGGLKLGSEIQLSYRREENETFMNEDQITQRQFLKNPPTGTLLPWQNFFTFIFPYNSKYWEILFKESLKGEIGPAKIAFTVRGGFIFADDNKFEYRRVTTTGASDFVDMDGDVKGWRMGGDLWVRFPLAKDLSVPMLVKVDYQKKTRDADGLGNGVLGIIPGTSFDYKNREKTFQVEVGGGLDKEFNKGTRIAAGIYYNYLKNKSDFLFTIDNSLISDHTNYPDQREHKVILRLAGEKEISPMFAMRMGLNFFYGWVNEDLKFNSNMITSTEKLSLDGSRWGIGASLGATVKVQRFSIEPFVGGGYQKLDLDGDGIRTGYNFLSEVDKLKKEWFVGGGFSVKF